MTTTILHTTAQVRQALQLLFSASTRRHRRVILTAYVGAEASTLLPDLRGIELCCWPQPGATNPHALRELKRLGAQISFADRLHMKVYWVDKVGCVITSANLSSNALGVNRLHEAGVLLSDPSTVPIDSMLASVPHRPMTLTALDSLQRAHDMFWSNNKGLASRTKAPPPQTFAQWVAAGESPPWKLSWYDGGGDEAPSTTEAARSTFGRSVEDFIDCSERHFEVGDWVLLYKRLPSERVGRLSWLLVQLVNRLTVKERVGEPYTHQAVQISRLSSVLRPPFGIGGNFGAAFRGAAAHYGAKKLAERDSVVPPPTVLRFLLKTLA